MSCRQTAEMSEETIASCRSQTPLEEDMATTMATCPINKKADSIAESAKGKYPSEPGGVAPDSCRALHGGLGGDTLQSGHSHLLSSAPGRRKNEKSGVDGLYAQVTHNPECHDQTQHSLAIQPRDCLLTLKTVVPDPTGILIGLLPSAAAPLPHAQAHNNAAAHTVFREARKKKPIPFRNRLRV